MRDVKLLNVLIGLDARFIGAIGFFPGHCSAVRLQRIWCIYKHININNARASCEFEACRKSGTRMHIINYYYDTAAA